MAVDEGDGWGDAVGELDRKAQAEESSGEEDGDAGNGVPDDVAEAAQAGKFITDPVPVGVEGDVVGGADGEEALGVDGDGAGVGDVELDAGAWGERLNELDCGFVELAGVVGVGVEGGDEKGHITAEDADALPVERGGDLQRDVDKGLRAV